MSVTHTASNPSSPKTGSNLNEITSPRSSPSVIDTGSPVMLSQPSNSSVGISLTLALSLLILTSPGDCQVMSITPRCLPHSSTSPSFKKWLCQIGSSINL